MAERVLLTGTTGFIGSHLERYLLTKGFEVFTFNRRKPESSKLTGRSHVGSLSVESDVRRVFDEVRPNYLIHLASRARPGRDLYEFSSQIEDTIMPAITLARLVPASTRLSVFVGSCEEYGNGPTPFQEDQQLVSMSPYGWAKIAAYDATQLILRQRGISFLWVRPFLTFGPGQNSEQLIPTLIRSCLAGEEVLLSPGEQTRDFIYIDDLCEMFNRLLMNAEKVAGRSLNLCSGKPRSIKSVAETIQRIIGRGTLKFGALPYRVNEAMSFYGSNKRFVDLIGTPQLQAFEAAIRETVLSYKTR